VQLASDPTTISPAAIGYRKPPTSSCIMEAGPGVSSSASQAIRGVLTAQASVGYRIDALRRNLSSQLQLIEPLVETVLSQQLTMAASFTDLAVMHDQNLVRVQDGAESVGHDDAGPSGHQLFDRSLDLGLRFGIHRTSGFVQHQNA